jgi:UDP-N-acetylmuramyl pentapeptide synthase
MDIETQVLLVGLTFIAALSPLLTFARLWQVKEWRLDRMREHLRAEGLLRQLFGILRPAAVAIYAILAVAGFFSVTVLLPVALAVLAAIAAVQFALRRQPAPVWTAKALMLTGTALLCTVLLTGAAAEIAPAILPVIILLQPLSLAAALTMWKPVDALLKGRILRKAMLARAALPPETVVIGITGSAGKTTTKELLSHILAERHPLTTPAHVNAEVGVARWLAAALGRATTPPGIVIVEMGAYRLGEIALLCTVARPTLGIVTSVGRQHIALFGSQEKLCKAKGELVEALPVDGHAFLNADNELCAKLRDRAGCPVTTVGTGGKADFEAFDIEETGTGIAFRAGDMRYEVPLHGTHNVTNVLLAIAVAQQCGMRPAEIAKRLHSFVPPQHTFAVRSERGVAILDDTHNASPASVTAAIAWARNQPAEEKVLLFSGLIELGESQDTIHTEIGSAASPVFDRVIMLSKHCLATVERGYGKPVELFSSSTPPVTSGTLLVCVGRMNERTMHALLPRQA